MRAPLRRMVPITAAVILLMPLIFVIVMSREVAGSMTVFTLRGAHLRIYSSDSGNLCLGVRHDRDRLKDPGWSVTRKNKVAWTLTNLILGYVDLPYLLSDALDQRD